jgi:hypothetical protein
MKHPDVRRKGLCEFAMLVAAGLALTASTAASAQRTQRYDNSNFGRVRETATYDRTGLPSGTVIPVRLNEPLSSRDASAGDKFTATLISGSDDAGLPEGTRLDGVVRNAITSRDGRPGSLDVDFRRISFPDGGSQSITASLYSLSGKAVKQSDGRLVAKTDKGKDRLKFIGIGAGAGLLIGTLTKQNTLLSLLLGAGAGYLYNETGSKPKAGDVSLKEGQEFGVRLDSRLAFNADTRRNYRGGVRQVSDSPDRSDRGGYSPYGDQVRVIVDDRAVRFEENSRPYIRNGVVFVPLGLMARAAQIDYRYDSPNRMIYARNDEARVGIGSRTATVDGRRRELPASAEQRNGVTFVPVQFIAWAANGSVAFDEATGTVTLSTDYQP